MKDLKLKTTAVPTIFDYDIDRRKRAKELLQHLKASLPDKLSDIEHAYAKKPEQEHLVIGPEEYPATKITSTLTIEMVPGQEDDIEEESEEPDGPEDPCDYYVENQDYEEGEFLEQEGEENEDNLRDPFEGVMEGITTTLTMTSDGKTIMEEVRPKNCKKKRPCVQRASAQKLLSSS